MYGELSRRSNGQTRYQDKNLSGQARKGAPRLGDPFAEPTQAAPA